ncbi:Hypothetical predicted protein [Olea europaea subsp. europaea]|nr:Hypothetical predicted protein [Olea europaea subsp. europaea]
MLKLEGELQNHPANSYPFNAASYNENPQYPGNGDPCIFVAHVIYGSLVLLDLEQLNNILVILGDAAAAEGDWKTQLPADSRQRIVLEVETNFDFTS